MPQDRPPFRREQDRPRPSQWHRRQSSESEAEYSDKGRYRRTSRPRPGRNSPRPVGNLSEEIKDMEQQLAKMKLELAGRNQAAASQPPNSFLGDVPNPAHRQKNSGDSLQSNSPSSGCDQTDKAATDCEKRQVPKPQRRAELVGDTRKKSKNGKIESFKTSWRNPEMLRHSNFLCELSEHEERYYLPIEIPDLGVAPILGLIDTGSHITLLSKQFYSQLTKDCVVKPKVKRFEGSLLGVDGNPLQVDGIVWYKLKVGNQIMKHPIIIVDLPEKRFIIGIDLLKRFNAIIDCVNHIMWSQVGRPLDYQQSQTNRSLPPHHRVEVKPGSVEIHFQNDASPEVTVLSVDPKVSSTGGDDNVIHIRPELITKVSLADDILTISLKENQLPKKGRDHPQFLADIEWIEGEPHVPVSIQGGAKMEFAKINLKAERSFISENFAAEIKGVHVTRYLSPANHYVREQSDSDESYLIVAKCLLSVRVGNKSLEHVFLVLRDSPWKIFVGNEFLHRFAAEIDTINDCIWSRLRGEPQGFKDCKSALRFQQTMPYAAEIEIAKNIHIPANANGFVVPLQVKQGHKLKYPEATICLSKRIEGSGIMVSHTPIVKINKGLFYIVINNTTSQGIDLIQGTVMGFALEANYYTFGFQNNVIGPIPEEYLTDDEIIDQTFSSFPEGLFSVHSIYPFTAEDGSCHIDETSLVFTQPMKDSEVLEVQSPQGGMDQHLIDLTQQLEEAYEIGKPEVFPGFLEGVEQQILLADGCQTDHDRHLLRELLMEIRDMFAKDSYDCGTTNLHVVRIPTDPDAPPVFARQYRLPLAAYESLAEIIKTLKDRGIIKKVHSTFNSPVLAVVKPNGQWRLCADLRLLNKRVYMSGWPVPHIDQCLAQIQGSQVFSAIDCAQGYWTIKVHEEDQHKLAFSFGDSQYTWTRLPFGFINSGHEFAVFMNKALPDAAERGTLTYVDDILVKSKSFEEHIGELRHVLTQLKTAGVKISLQKAQLCRSKVNFLGHEITSEGLNPQKKKVEAVINCKAPTTLRELRSFLGMANYSRKFIDEYAELAKPLLLLLKKNTPWDWGEEQEKAFNELKHRLTQAPCLAYPELGKPFYLETGFTERSMSAILYQKNNNVGKIVSYASKALSPVEMKFNECEKALLSNVWALQHFRSFIQGEKIIVETAHQPLLYLHSNRIRDGKVSNSRITAWTLALQGWPIEVSYKQDRKNPVSQGLAELHCCTESTNDNGTPGEDFIEEQKQSPHREYDENICKELPTVFVDGCSYHHPNNGERPLVAGIGIIWVGENTNLSVGHAIGPRSSQIAELTAIFKTVQMAIELNIKEFVIITDSEYVKNSFVEYLPRWKRNHMLRTNNKPVSHSNLFLAIDELVLNNDLSIYWKKTKGHSKVPGNEKEGNDRADQLAKQSALNGELLDITDIIGVIKVEAITRGQAKDPDRDKCVQMDQEFPSDDLITCQKEDPIVGKFYNFIQNPDQYPLTSSDCKSTEDLRILFNSKSQFKIQDGLLVRTTKGGILQWVVPSSHRGLMLQHAHDAPFSGHRGEKVTHEILREFAYWPHMLKDVQTYCQGCLVCPQFQPNSPTHRAPLQKRGVTLPWSDIQMDFIGPVTRSSRGNKYMLTVTCLFTKWVECIPAPNNSAETCATLLINHIFSRFGLPQRVESDRGSHFTSEVMTKMWQILGVKRKLHIAYRAASSGGVERYNQSIVKILKKYVNENGRDWDMKLPLVLMALRSTPSRSTKLSPFELMTGRRMTLPQHLLYRVTDQTLSDAVTTHQYIEDLRKHLQSAFAFAQKNLERAADSAKTYYDLKTTKKEYDINDKVYLFNFARIKQKEKKFLPSWKGPYTIIDKISPVAYKVRIPKGDDVLEKWVHINQLRVCHPRTRLQAIENGI